MGRIGLPDVVPGCVLPDDLTVAQINHGCSAVNQYQWNPAEDVMKRKDKGSWAYPAP